MGKLLAGCGAVVLNIGAERRPSEIAKEAPRSGSTVIMVSTHNDMALEYAHHLLEELNELDISVDIIMGGVLNQKTDTFSLPADVVDDLKKLGIRTSVDIKELATIFRNIEKRE